MNPSSPSQDCHMKYNGFSRFLMDQGAHFQTHQKPLTVMNVHNRAKRKHLRAIERETWTDEIQKLNDREARAALPLSALIVG